MTERPWFHRASNVVSQSLAGEEGAVLLNVETGVYHGLNSVGAKIWEFLESPRTEGDLVDCIAEAFQVEPDAASADVREFLKGLDERELIQRTEAP